MPGAYFQDDTSSIELGASASVLASATRRMVVVRSRAGDAQVTGADGGLLGLTVVAHRLRANLGDAERYAWETLRALAAAGTGTLGIEDAFGARTTFGSCACRRASARMTAGRLVEMRLDFVAAERSAQPAWSALPDTPGTWPGTDTLRDYAVDGVSLGDRPAAMRLEMERDTDLRVVPRTRGARATIPGGGALLRLSVTGWLQPTGGSPVAAFDGLVRSIGTAGPTLSGNGNSYANVRLEAARPLRVGRDSLQFVITFLQEVTP